MGSWMGIAPAALGSAILAHQGGWDEILLVVGPIAVIVVALMLVKRRLDATGEGVDPGEQLDSDTAQSPPVDAPGPNDDVSSR